MSAVAASSPPAHAASRTPPPVPLPPIPQRIASEIGSRPAQVEAAIALLDEGATVPFIARYRKEATDGLDDTQLRTLEERLLYLRELEARREAVIASVAEQGKLTPELEAALRHAPTKQQLEDLYLPYKPKRRTKASIAREAGLEPLAFLLLAEPARDPLVEAAALLAQLQADPERAAKLTEAKINSPETALEGARHILVEHFAEEAALVGVLREQMWRDVRLFSRLVDETQKSKGEKFSDYFAYDEALREIPSHRALALLRGRNEGILSLALQHPQDVERAVGEAGWGERAIARHFHIAEQGRAGDRWLRDTVRLAWRGKVGPSLETELLAKLREAAEQEAIRVFGSNLKDLLLAAPAGPRVTMGLDPGLRTGVKVAVVDATGKLLTTETIYPHVPQNQWDAALRTLAGLVRQHKVELIAIGNGTASRETDRLAGDLIKAAQAARAVDASLPARLDKLVVSEAGASVYSASELAAHEFPTLDVSLRGAVSIARRLQDPLAELVKIDPKAIGVGQYQHDVDQPRLARTLDAVVEDCVNAVGVDVNRASIPLLTRISGLNTTLAANIVAYRDEHGAFPDRSALRKVPRLGEKAFEQAAGFLRIPEGADPLDASSVHPEAYPLVAKIAAQVQKPMQALIGDSALLRRLDPADFIDARFGLPTVRDILAELDKPGRDPRPHFQSAQFQEGVESLADLKLDMVLEGVITNVANFGAFIDIGVHQDGLAHISELSATYVKDPREVVRVGQLVKVKVLEVDIPRRRIALTLRLDRSARDAHSPCEGSGAGRRSGRTPGTVSHGKPARAGQSTASHAPQGAMAAAFAALKQKPGQSRGG